MRRLLVGLLLLLAPPALAQSQPPTTLIADTVTVEGEDTLVASGAVEVLSGQNRLRARRITYNGKTGALDIEGPITLVDPRGNILIADTATMDKELMNGILTSARLVLDQKLQIAANQARRVDGRLNEMTKVVASSCQVCAANPVPLWSVRARRLVHDEDKQRLYFDHATFQVANVPVFWVPRFSLPDPSVKRATGFLAPSIQATSQIGTGVRVPYFIAIGDSRDLTLAPFVSPHTKTLEYRYRQAFRTGEIEISGAFSHDDFGPRDRRAFLFANGSFRLPRGFRLTFGIQSASDRAYLLDYDYSDQDRLRNFIGIDRVRRDELIDARIFYYRTLRDSEIPIEDTLPYLIGEFTYDKRLPGIAGGEARLAFTAHGHERASADNVLGQDVARIGVKASWERTWISRQGVETTLEGSLTEDSYFVGQNSNYPPQIDLVTPAVGATFRWPFARTTAGGASQLLEPVAQVVWSRTYGGTAPNEDSTLVEYDEGNLLSMDRFPGHDATEDGLRAALGLSFTHIAPGGWTLGTTVGRVFRTESDDDFPTGSGLRGTASDWLAAIQLRSSGGLELTGRMVFGDDFSMTKSETRITWHSERLTLNASYLWLREVPEVVGPSRTSEMTFDTGYKFTQTWSGSAALRYDFETGRAQRAGFGIGYRNECLAVDLSLSRRFTSSTSVEPTTDVGLQVSLNGFGNDGRGYRGTCAG